MSNEKIKKCLKSYLTGKTLLEKDKNKALGYFEQCLKYLNLKENKEKYIDLLKETETECNKFINKEKKINLFGIIETGEIDKLENISKNQLDFTIYDKEGNTPIHKAIKYGDTTFLKICFKYGAPIDIVNKEGYTPLEYACLQKDPNMISFLLNNGCNMKKHLFFRDGTIKHFNNQLYIDNAIILKIIFTYPKSCDISELEFLFNHFKIDEDIGFDNLIFDDFIKSLQTVINTLPKNSKETYINIIREELLYPLNISLKCPTKKIDILLINLIVFIEFPFNISIDWYLHLELKYFFIKILKDKNKIDLNEKKIIVDYIWEKYVKTNLLQDEYLGNIIYQFISKYKKELLY